MPGFAFANENIQSGRGPNPAVNTARTYRWRISKLGPVSANSLSGVSTQWYAKSLGFPAITSHIEEAQGAGVKYKFAGHVNYTNCTISMYNVLTRSGTSIKTVLENWVSKVYGGKGNGRGRPAGNIDFNETHVADDYKDTSSFALRDEFGADETELTLFNSWPYKLGHTNLDYTKNEIAELEIELVFDWYRLTSSVTSSGNTAPNQDGIARRSS